MKLTNKIICRVSRELRQRMKENPRNWSQIIREAIEQALDESVYIHDSPKSD